MVAVLQRTVGVGASLDVFGVSHNFDLTRQLARQVPARTTAIAAIKQTLFIAILRCKTIFGAVGILSRLYGAVKAVILVHDETGGRPGLVQA